MGTAVLFSLPLSDPLGGLDCKILGRTV